MAETIKDTVADAGQVVADAAKVVGQSIAGGAGKVVDFVKDKAGLGTPAEEGPGGTHIAEGMDVIASDGAKVGVVDHMEGETIKLAKGADGNHHFIPAKWVERVDKRVRLKKTGQETEQGWTRDAAAVG
jgi:hypothetical protein